MDEKKQTNGIYFTCTEAQKRKIRSLADKCGLGQGEYILKRALGYEPKTVLPGAFFDFHEKLCELLENPMSPAMEEAALRVFDEIYAQLIDNRKQPQEEIIAEMKEGDFSGSPQNQGFCGETEHPRIGETFEACGKSERKERDATWLPSDSGP